MIHFVQMMHSIIHSSKKETPCLKNCILFENPGEHSGVMGLVRWNKNEILSIPVLPLFITFASEKRGVSFLGECSCMNVFKEGFVDISVYSVHSR